MLSAIFYGLRISLAVGVDQHGARARHRPRRRAGRGVLRRPGRGADHAHRRHPALVPGDPDRADPDRRAGAGRRQDHHRAGHRAVGVLRAHGALRRAGRARKEYIEAARCLALSPARIVFRHLLPNCLPPLIVVATVQVARGDRARGDAVVPRPRPADHRAVARPADRQRLPVPALGQVLDQLLPGHRAAADDRQHQPRRRPAARRAQPAAAAMSDARPPSSRSRVCARTSSPRRAS